MVSGRVKRSGPNHAGFLKQPPRCVIDIALTAEFHLDLDARWRSKAQHESPPAALPGTSGARPTRVGV